MAREAEKIIVRYRDETGEPAEVELDAQEGLTVGQCIDRITNGAVTNDSHVINNNGCQARLSDPVADGDNLQASPRKTAGG